MENKEIHLELSSKDNELLLIAITEHLLKERKSSLSYIFGEGEGEEKETPKIEKVEYCIHLPSTKIKNSIQDLKEKTKDHLMYIICADSKIFFKYNIMTKFKEKGKINKSDCYIVLDINNVTIL